MVPGPRSEAGQWFLLRLLIDPTTGPTNHALGTVFHAGVARDYRDLTPRRSLEEAGALEVGEELVAQPHAVARALDQSRHVGNGELAAVPSVDRPEDRLDRRERVVRRLGAALGQRVEERGLARVGHADDPDLHYARPMRPSTVPSAAPARMSLG